MPESNGKEFLGRGWKFPVQIDQKTGRIKLSEYDEDIKEAIRIIIMTYRGERVMRSNFGSTAKDYTFKTNSIEDLTLMKTDIYNSIFNWEPRITDLKVAVHPNSGDNAMVLIEVSYVVRSTNNGYNMVYPFYLYEGLQRIEDV